MENGPSGYSMRYVLQNINFGGLKVVSHKKKHFMVERPKNWLDKICKVKFRVDSSTPKLVKHPLWNPHPSFVMSTYDLGFTQVRKQNMLKKQFPCGETVIVKVKDDHFFSNICMLYHDYHGICAMYIHESPLFTPDGTIRIRFEASNPLQSDVTRPWPSNKRFWTSK